MDPILSIQAVDVAAIAVAHFVPCHQSTHGWAVVFTLEEADLIFMRTIPARRREARGASRPGSDFGLRLRRRETR
jgi:hypothetical protein